MPDIINFKDLKQIINSRTKELEFIKYLKQFSNKTIVIKYGGSALETTQKISYLVDDLIFLKQQNINAVLIHGGSRQLNNRLKTQNIKNEVIDGIRVTTKEILGYAIEVFKQVNDLIVKEINLKGHGKVKAIGFNGHEIPIVISDFLDKEKYQYVGKVKKIETKYLNVLKSEYIPVLSSLSVTSDGQPLNVNADTGSAKVAIALQAEKYILMTDTDGILDANGRLVSSIDYKLVQKMLGQNTIFGGMIPKIKACLDALEGGVKKVHIINGTKPYSLAKELFTDEGIGTEIIGSSKTQKETHVRV